MSESHTTRRAASKPELTDTQRSQLDRARDLATMPLDGIPAAMDADPGNLGLAYGLAFGEARAHIRGLLAVIDELTAGGAR